MSSGFLSRKARGLLFFRRPKDCVSYLSVTVVSSRLKHGYYGYGELEFDTGEGA
jgi:hypothetical protein